MPTLGKFKSKNSRYPLFYKIITDNQTTKLVYNLVYSKVRGWSAGITGAVSYSGDIRNHLMKVTLAQLKKILAKSDD